MIFVKNSHFVWNPSRQRKMRKKLGNLIQSPKDGLDDMLEQHLEEGNSSRDTVYLVAYLEDIGTHLLPRYNLHHQIRRVIHFQ